MIQASIDLGTNTCLLLVIRWNAKTKKIEEVLHDQSTIVRLGQGVQENKKLHPEAKMRVKNCLKEYQGILKKYDLSPSQEQVIAVTTATARNAVDAKEFFDEIKKEIGFQFQVLSGEEEARLMFLGGIPEHAHPEKSLVIDIGGGSTEFKSARAGVSFPIGSVQLTEKYLQSDPVTDEEFWKCQDEVDALFQNYSFKKEFKEMATLPSDGFEFYGVAGTLVALAGIQLRVESFDPTQLNGCVLTRGDAHRLTKELKWRTISERQSMPGMEKKRADVLLAGALILWRAMEAFDLLSVRVSTRGLRYGVFFR